MCYSCRTPSPVFSAMSPLLALTSTVASRQCGQHAHSFVFRPRFVGHEFESFYPCMTTVAVDVEETKGLRGHSQNGDQ